MFAFVYLFILVQGSASFWLLGTTVDVGGSEPRTPEHELGILLLLSCLHPCVTKANTSGVSRVSNAEVCYFLLLSLGFSRQFFLILFSPFTVIKVFVKTSSASLSFLVLSYKLDYFCTQTKLHIALLISAEVERNQLLPFSDSIALAADLRQMY